MPTAATNVANLNTVSPNPTVINLPNAAAVAVYVGDTATGMLSITSGGRLTDEAAYIGRLSGSTGSATVDGAGSKWTHNVTFQVGVEGAGALNITDGGQVIGPIGVLGQNASGTGSAVVDGVGSKWSATSMLYVGFNGAGTLEVRNGGEVAAATGLLGNGFSGSATIDGVGSKWSNSGEFHVGRFGTGTLNVTNGGAVSNTAGFVGTSVGARGTATIDGEGSTWNNTSALTVGDFHGAGTLNVTQGGAVTSVGGYIALADQSTGDVTVDGVGSTWTATGELRVGDVGVGTLTVKNGGLTSNVNSFVGNTAGSHGTATVDGAGSTWSNSGQLVVGRFGDGELNVKAGGRVTNTNGFIGNSTAAGARGAAVVQGSGATWANSGQLHVGLNVGGALTIADGGVVTSQEGAIASRANSTGTATVGGPGSKWQIDNRLGVGGDAVIALTGGTGSLTVQAGGEVSVGQTTVLFNGGTLNLDGGVLSTDRVTPQGGTFNWNSGTLHVGTYAGPLTNSAGVLAPGHSAGTTTVNGMYTQQAGGAMEIELGGVTQGVDFDFVNVVGTANLDGQLRLAVLDGYLPDPADMFTVLGAGILSGEFANATPGSRVPTIDGKGSFLVDYGATSEFDPNQIVLSAFELGADVDGDGAVDGEDLAVWEDGFGEAGDANPEDGDMDGDMDVDGGDFLIWQQEFGAGEVVEGGVAGVPEPGSAALVAAAIVGIARFRRRAAQRHPWPPVPQPRTRRAVVHRICLASGLVCAAVAPAEAQIPTTGWTNPLFGNWFVESNWHPVVPTSVWVAQVNYGVAIVDAPGAEAAFLFTGYNEGDGGLVSVTGAGRLTMTARLFLRRGGLEMVNGGRVVVLDNPNIGRVTEIGAGDATGTAVVSGPGSFLSSGTLYLATSGWTNPVHGVLRVESGGRMETTTAYVGYAVTGSATATVTGANSVWEISDSLWAGFGGSATSLNVTAGGTVNARAVLLGKNATVTVNGAGSSLSDVGLGSTTTVGFNGTSTLNVQNNGLVTSTNAILGDGSVFTALGSGTVNVAGGAWFNSGTLAIGGSPTDTENEANFGGLLVTGGGVVNSGAASVGAQRGSIGSAAFSGAGSRWTVNGDAIVGRAGNGTLYIGAGATVSGTGGHLGLNAGVTGTALLTGAGSRWTSSADLLAGASGTGSVEVRNGARLETFRAHLGFNASGSGSVLVTDAGSSWSAGGSMFIGNGGIGSIQVLNGATAATAGNSYLGFSTFSTGQATVRGSGSTWSTANTLYIGGNADGPGGPFSSMARAEDSGRINAGNTVLYNTGILELLNGGTLNSPLTARGGLMRTQGDVSYAGDVSLEAGGLTVVALSATGAATFSGALSGVGGLTKSGLGSSATLRLTGASTYAGPTTLNSGTLLVDGSITSATTVNNNATLGGSGVVGAVDVKSGGTISPGSSPGTLTTGAAVFRAGGNYNFELRSDGTGAAGLEWDSLAIGGTLDLTDLSAANPFNIRLRTIDGANNASPLGGWNPGVDHLWSNVATTTSGLTGAFDATLFKVDTTGFLNPIHGSFSVVEDSGNLNLFYDATDVDDGVLVTNLAEPLRYATPIGNNPNPVDPPEGSGAPWYWAAQSFKVDDFPRQLVSIAARVGNGSAAPAPVVVAELRADNGGTIGDLIATLTAPDVSAPPSAVEFTPTGAVTLDPQSSYWFVLGSETPGDGTFFWEYINSAFAAGPGVVGNFADSSDSGGAWLYHGSEFPYYIQVNATIAPPPVADFDGDGFVGEEDLEAWNAGFGEFDGVENPAGPEDGDADGDFDVDGEDFLAWQQQFEPVESDVAIAAPEPEFLVLGFLVIPALRGGIKLQARSKT